MRKNKPYAVITVNTDDAVRLIGLDDYHITLEQLYEWSSCDTIQIIRTELFMNNPYLLMCIDDNGKLLQKPINLIGTLLYGQYPIDFIVGDLVIGTSFTENPNDEPDMYALPYEEAKRIYDFCAKLKR